MKDFDIVPHQGIGPIPLGMTREEVREVFGTPDHTHNERDWFLRGFGVDFDDDDGHVRRVDPILRSSAR